MALLVAHYFVGDLMHWLINGCTELVSTRNILKKDKRRSERRLFDISKLTKVKKFKKKREKALICWRFLGYWRFQSFKLSKAF